ncbi:MAG: hypothetical protein LJE91_01530 [Gammaproteobacteria bacterium]|jgi:hypothetical protein|nr:hypothetical protein [Gammaproteobacteria bacterium]
MSDEGGGFQLGLLLAIALIAIGVGNLLALVHLARYFNRRDRKHRPGQRGAGEHEP